MLSARNSNDVFCHPIFPVLHAVVVVMAPARKPKQRVKL